MKKPVITLALILWLAQLTNMTYATDDLPSWNDTPTRQAIENFVDSVTDAQNPDYIERAARIAVFDNDGTLWAEQPIYFQLYFAMDRVKELAPDHPEWKTEQPFKAAIEGDLSTVAESGMKGLTQLLMASHANISATEFADSVADWVQTARHPDTGLRYTEMVYQPMLELLDYLRANDFKVYIVSGGGIEFMRVFAEEVYGVVPEQVIGSSIKTSYKIVEGKPVLMRLPEMNFVDDKEGKPVGINQHIGRRPIAAFGNSDGDFQMLEWTTAGEGRRMGGLVHHTDEEREWAYDRDSHIGKLARGLDEAADRNWVVIDMKKDWTSIFPKQP
jgi:hypothetical protein